MERLEYKLNRWRGFQASFAGRVMVINTFPIPTTLYFLAFWRPSKAIKKVNSLCRNFLWAGDPFQFKIPKVSCTPRKDKGGLGIIRVADMADRLASKWIIRSWIGPFCSLETIASSPCRAASPLLERSPHTHSALQ